MKPDQSEAAIEAIDELSLAPKHDDRPISLPTWMMPYRQTLCAAVASLYALGVGFPLDSVKTRQQTYKYDNFWQCIKHTKKTEGIGGFYRGIAAPLLSSSIVRALSVSVYSTCLPYTSKLFFDLYGPPDANKSTTDRVLRTTPGAFMAGSMAGISCSALAAPFEFTKLASQIEYLVKTRHQSIAGTTSSGSTPNGTSISNKNNATKPSGTLDVAKRLVQKNGVKALYSGFRYHLMRDFIGSGVYFTVYDGFKVAISSMLGKKAHPASIAIAGGLAGTVSWIIIYPIDTFKSLIQKDIYSKSLLGVERPVRHFRGVLHAKMYRGLGVSLLRTSVMGMMFFSCYEWLIKVV